MDKSTLIRNEPILTKLFQNAVTHDRVAGAYLLCGQRNSPLKETAIFLSKSLNCENGPFACDDCPNCRRFNHGVRPDFCLIDGETTTIKKEDIKALIDQFSMASFSKGHRLCYVIHRIENITEEAANALLKFLEEPKEGQVAFLTTYNINKVLPTIVSRSLSVRVDPIHPDQFMENIMNEEFLDGKKKRHVSTGEAYMLSRLYSDMEEVKTLIEGDDSFRNGYEIAEEFLNELSLHYDHASYILLKQNTVNKEAKCYNWMYLTLDEAFSQILEDDIEESNPLKDVLIKLSEKKGSIAKGEEVIKDALSHRQLNFNPTLTISRLLVALYEGK